MNTTELFNLREAVEAEYLDAASNPSVHMNTLDTLRNRLVEIEDELDARTVEHMMMHDDVNPWE